MKIPKLKPTLIRGCPLVLILLVAAFLNFSCAAQVRRSDLGGPFPIDISRADSRVDTEIHISEYRDYFFYLDFHYQGATQFYKLLKLVGDPNVYFDGQYSNPGITVPVRIRVVSENGVQLCDQLVETKGQSSHTFVGKGDGFISRQITSVTLKPGIYRVFLDTTKEIPDFTNVKGSLSIQWKFNTKPLQE